MAREVRHCPYCQAEVSAHAILCRTCNRSLVPYQPPPPRPARPLFPPPKTDDNLRWVLIGCPVVAAITFLVSAPHWNWLSAVYAVWAGLGWFFLGIRGPVARRVWQAGLEGTSMARLVDAGTGFAFAWAFFFLLDYPNAVAVSRTSFEIAAGVHLMAFARWELSPPSATVASPSEQEASPAPESEGRVARGPS